MPRVKTHKARLDTYTHGLKVKSETKSGFRVNRFKPRDSEDEIFCPKGETYYTWSFRYGGTYRSRVSPKASQLTQSEFLGAVYAIDEDKPLFQSKEELSQWIEEVVCQLEELRDEQEEKRENMPYSLQESPTAELLQNRYDSVQEWIGELEQIDCEDEDTSLEDLESEISEYCGE